MADSCEDLFGEEEPCESVGISSNNAELLEAGNNSAEYLNDTESLIALAQPELFPNVRDEVHTCPTTLPKILENEVEFTFPSKIQQEDYKEGLHRGQETLVEDLHVPYDKFTLPSKESCKTDSEETCRRSTAGDQLSSNPKGEKSDNHNTNFNSPVLFSSQELKSDVVVSEKSNSSVELHRENREETDFRRRYAGSKVNTVEKAFDTAYSPACFKIRKKQEENGNSSQAKGAQHKEITKPKELSLFRYLMAEISRGYLMELEEDKYTEKRRKVYKIMKIPKEFEKLMVFGFMLCLDCFLFIFTYLPLRVAVALFNLLCGIFCFPRTRLLEPAQICDLLKGTIIVLCSTLLIYVDFSVMYHTVRGQSVIKLYVIYNMLEIADRLFSSFGQDILDSLFWTATEPKDQRREHIGILPHFVLAVIYVFLHAVLVLFQATCLNVAVNSHNKALLVIMVSNQFIELKGSVFKRFEKNNLFQMACSDIRERFHYIILVTICALRNLTEFNWNLDHLYVILPYLMAVLISEYFVDWIKHAFITKFNDIPVEVYSEYRAHLAQDATSSRQKNAHSDHFDLVSRRMGFIPLPLASVMLRVVTQSIKFHGIQGICLIITAYFFLTSAKVLNSIIFLGKAFQYVNENQQKTGDEGKNAMSAKNINTQAPGTLLDSNHPSQDPLGSPGNRRFVEKPKSDGEVTKRRAKTLAEIDRYTLCSKEIVVF